MSIITPIKNPSLSIQVERYKYMCIYVIILYTHILLVLFHWRMLKNTVSHILYFERRLAITQYSAVFSALVFQVNFRINQLGKKKKILLHVCVCVCVCLHNSSYTENSSSVKDPQTLLCASKIFLPVTCFPSLLISNPFVGQFADVLHLRYATRLMASNLRLQLSFFCKLGLGLGQLWVKNILGQSFQIVFRPIYQEHTEIEMASSAALSCRLTFPDSFFQLWFPLCTLPIHSLC